VVYHCDAEEGRNKNCDCLVRGSQSVAILVVEGVAGIERECLPKTRYVINASRDMHIIINSLSIS
jgi:hypothetical protein